MVPSYGELPQAKMRSKTARSVRPANFTGTASDSRATIIGAQACDRKEEYAGRPPRHARQTCSIDRKELVKVPLTSRNNKRSWAVSLAFWLSLIVASGLYACVALSPKLVNYLQIQADFHATQVELVGLERDVRYLDRVANALERPDFSEELARVDFDAARPGDERIRVKPIGSPVNRDALDAGVPEKSVVRPAVLHPWYMPLLDMLATDEKLRRGFLISAAVIILVAFTFLQEVHCKRPSNSRSRLTGLGWSQLRDALTSRYGRSR